MPAKLKFSLPVPMKTISSKLSKAAPGPKFPIIHAKKNDTEGLEDVMKLSINHFFCKKFACFPGRVCTAQVGFFHKFMIIEPINLDSVVFE
jgi:hypothetical protein